MEAIMKLARKLETEESRKRWDFIDKASDEINKMDEWKKIEGRSIESQRKMFEASSALEKTRVE